MESKKSPKRYGEKKLLVANYTEIFKRYSNLVKYINKAWTVYIIASVKVIDDNINSTDYKQVCIVAVFNVAKAFDYQ